MFKIIGFLKPSPSISEAEQASGLKWLSWEGMASLGFSSITTSGFLTAYALALGANNLQIGILVALPFLGGVLQIPTILLVERVRQRKLIAVITWFIAQLLWIPIALIPFYLKVPGAPGISVLLAIMAARSILQAVTNGAWHSWVRDLVPQQIMGSFFARRFKYATVVAMIFGVGAALFVDYWKSNAAPGTEATGYVYPLILGAVTLGIASPLMMAKMPEPLMESTQGQNQSIRNLLTIPYRNRNYRYLLLFLLLWGFCLNLAVPFFTVYMLVRLELPVSAVIGFSALSQIFTILFYRVWGQYADRYGSKSVMAVCASLYLLVIFGWTFTTMPDRYFLTIPLLVVLHIMAGIASSGVTLTTGTLGMKLAPKGQATAYLTTAAVATSLGTGLGPLLGGPIADFFSSRQLGLVFSWTDPSGVLQMSAFHLTGFDFLFAIAFVLGLMVLGLLTMLREEGEVDRDVVLDALVSPLRRFTKPLGSTASLSFLSQFPFGYIRKVPLPGLDVAIGVTAHQLAEAASMAVIAVKHGRRGAAKISGALEKLLIGLLGTEQASGVNVTEISQHAARGAMRAVEQTNLDAGEVARQTVVGIASALHKQGGEENVAEALRGAAYGMVQGASETGAQLETAVSEAVEAAKEVAQQTGIDQDVAVSQVVIGAIEAAKDIGKEPLEEIKSSLSKETIAKAIAGMESETEKTKEVENGLT
ncbi:MAG: MFS transporter [Dehalococcoidia bacterium]